jgi:fumarylacetoacetate (FAA) hydrolase
LGDNWRDGRIQASLHTTWNGRKIGMCDCGQHMPKHAGQWLSMASHPSGLGAGSVWLSGPVANEGHTTEQQLHQWPKGYHHIAHKRAMEQAQTGHMHTDFLQANDTLHIDMKGRDGQSLFGAIAYQLHDAQNHAALGD